MEALENDTSTSSQKGYRAGYANGALMALKVGRELGSYEGFAAVTSELRHERPIPTDKKRYHLERIVRTCAEITPSAKDGEILGKLEMIRGLARRAGIPDLSSGDKTEKKYDF